MSQKTIEYKNLPSNLRILSRTLFKSQSRTAIPNLHFTVEGFQFDQAHLQSYKRYCGFTHVELPLPYLFVASQKAQLHLLTDKQFPLRTLGLIHSGIRFYRHKELDTKAKYDVTVSVGRVENKPRGIEFELCVRFYENGELVSGFDSHYFSITSNKRGNKPVQMADDFSAFQRLAQLNITEQSVRGYARVSGDYNPIHLHRLTAAPFGFKRPIAHGLYLLARCLVSLDITPTEVEATFKRPALLPIKTELIQANTQALLLNADRKALLDIEWID
ncbi:MaoC/PaaZ C-terminal domain-containing protein [Vibrio comitans]